MSRTADRAGRLGLLAAILIAAGGGGSAQATEQTASAGGVDASLSFAFDSSDNSFSDLRLIITRAGTELYDDSPAVAQCREPYCYPAGGRDRTSVRVADLNGDGEPEVLVDLYTAGAHCCFVTRIFAFDGERYRSIQHGFADAGYRLGDINDDHRLELVSGDARFGYRFAAFAFSPFPVQIWRFAGGRLTDATQHYKVRIRSDADRQWGLYQTFRMKGWEVRGAIAAWAADEYRLGHRRSVLGRLRAMGATGALGAGGPAFVGTLDGFLRRLHYGSTHTARASAVGVSSRFTVPVGVQATGFGAFDHNGGGSDVGALRAAFGAPSSRQGSCVLRWTDLGLTVVLGTYGQPIDACAAGYFFRAKLTDPRWHTTSGIHPESTAAQARRRAVATCQQSFCGPGVHGYVLGRHHSECAVGLYPRVIAEIHGGRVRSLIVLTTTCE